MLSSLPNPYSRPETGDYATAQKLLYPTTGQATFLPTLIPLDGAVPNAQIGTTFAQKLAQEYRCLSGGFTVDCCQQRCSVPSNGRVRDYQVVPGDYPITFPEQPIVMPSCSVRTK